MRVLVAEPDAVYRDALVQALDGFEVFEAASCESALQALDRLDFSLVIAGMHLGPEDGPRLVNRAGCDASRPLVVVVTESARCPIARSAMGSGGHDMLVDPTDPFMTASVLRRSLRELELRRENQALLHSLKQNVEALGLQNQRLENLATRDELTGLYNYRYFRHALDVELSRCRRYDRILSLIFADVDHFKDYNDTQGHLAGDTALETLGAVISEGARKSTVIARYGGEEFVLMVPESDLRGAVQYAEEIRARVEAHQFHGRAMTMSFGVASFPECGQDANELIKHADDALYRAKDSGRNSVRG